ncbi:alanine dehydrogenase [Methanobacterium formicicum]|uniref:Alanine dehydrogenase n=1 Tax=Methanobacterium formicicum (strain DSM 3637 / PP1) TaxID=1204725 RepID=K2R710_METFP|nr:alanine dehydrogenase [Methanobacterium formicicum]EKF86997.1 alanine dehydrogenase [Methanobacterium formicicum DSM 3637]
MSGTLILKQSEIKKLINMKEVVESVETAFKAYAERDVQMPAKEYLFFHEGDLRIMPCYVRSSEEAGVKCVNVHPKNPLEHQLPTVMAVIELVDPATGFPLAVMDGTLITDLRTGAAAGVATKYLARPDSETLGIIGAGKQACTQLMALNEVMDITKAKVFCRTCSTRTNFAKTASKLYGFDVEAVETAQEAVKNVDVIVTTTPSRKPLISADWISPGTHINAMGADAPSKQELETRLLLKSRIIIDSWDQASHSGEINVPVSQGVIKQKDIHAKLGDVVIGKETGREGDEITIFDSTGLAVQDVVTAGLIYRRAREQGVGMDFDFIS